ncbi:MAG: anthranilate phosphoribosyltransferase [Dehalococcoidales bacterium]|nr:anthranilate phosphoribosyltransferase [Dehalococcoidales bacterium]
MIKEAIQTLVSGQSLTRAEAAAVMDEIMEGKATPSQLGGFLVAMRMKGETAEEIAGMITVMRAKALRVNTAGPLLDIVGTGGDGTGTFNISTAAAFVAAGAGLKIAKHGNRAASSRCGSADVLETLGIKIELTPIQVQQCIEQVGIGFMFAQAFHPAMKHVGPTRRELAIRTFFNFLGPLSNPAGAEYLVIGIPDKKTGEMLAGVLARLSTKHALVVHGAGGMDEISITGDSIIWEVKNTEVLPPYHINPVDFGMNIAQPEEIRGSAPSENARIIRAIFNGEKSPRRDIVILNAAAGLLAAERVKTFQDGTELAGKVIDDGRAFAKLEQLAGFTQQLERNVK